MPTFSNFVNRLTFFRLSSNDRNLGFLSKLKYSIYILAKNFEVSEITAVKESGNICVVLRK